MSITFVIGLPGSDRIGTGRRLAEETGAELFDTDCMIEERDGRSIRRICMMAGEHGYRNQEYELLFEICEGDFADANSNRNLIVVCGDGIILDDDSRDLIKKQNVIVAGLEERNDELWARAKDDKKSYYAFMSETDEEVKYAGFCELCDRRRRLYEAFVE